MTAFHIFGQWAVGAVAFLLCSATVCSVIWFFASDECEEWREGIGFLGLVAALVFGLTYVMYVLGGTLISSFGANP